MTRKEAIKVLSNYDVNGVWADVDGNPYNAEEQAEAFDMAIEALQTDIVHCEECEWWQKQDDSLQGRCAKYGFYPTGRYFCAGGERRENKDYERATEQLEHDILYEPTYNQDDGSM